MSDLGELAKLHHEASWLRFQKREDAKAWQRAWRQKDRWDSRWADRWESFLLKQQRRADMEKLVKLGRKAYGRVRKAEQPPPPSYETVMSALIAQMGMEQFASEGLKAYLGFAVQVGEDAGQFTLDALGLNTTFAWAGEADFPKNVLAVRGSKVIQHHHGNHLEQLARMVVQKCDPTSPQTIGELIRGIRQEWGKITRRDAERIARTEAANVWETVAYNAMRLNGVTRVDWLIARGPAIGVTRLPVCKQCLAKAARSPYVLDEMDDVPPAHPNCRCTLIPALDTIWLPPAEPWTGAETKLETFT